MTARAFTPADESFDDLARGLAKGTVSRRRALALVASSMLGGALGSVALVGGDAAKSCKKKCNKKNDKKAKRRCKKRCAQKVAAPNFTCQNLGTACGLGAKTLVCNCRLDKEGNQTCANVVNPPDGVDFANRPCALSSDCASTEVCDFGGNVCRTKCETS